jgi:hypothetical protein
MPKENIDYSNKRGFKNLYGTDTVKLRKNKSTEWVSKGYGRIANYMVMSCSN